MPLPINPQGPQGVGAGGRLPEDYFGDPWPNGLRRRVGQHIVRQPPPEQPAEVVIPAEQPAAEVTAPMGWRQMLRLFFTSLSPMAQAGVEVPQLTVPTAADVAALGLSMATGTNYGTMLRSGQMTFTGLSRARARGRQQGEDNGAAGNTGPQGAASSSSAGVSVECAAVGGWQDLTNPPQEQHGGSDAPSTATNRHAERTGRPSTGVQTRSADEILNLLTTAKSVRDNVTSQINYESVNYAREAVAIMDAADAQEEALIAPDAFDSLSTQVVCEVEDGNTFPISLSWLDREGQYHEMRTHCEESLVLEVPRGAEPVIVEPPMMDLTGSIFARVWRTHTYADGRVDNPVALQAAIVLKLARQLEHDQQWGSLLAVTEHFLAEVDEAKAPDLTAQMRAYKTEAEHHIHQQAIDRIPDPLTQTMLGILGGAGMFVLTQWYDGYRRGERGMPLVTRPMAEVAAGVRQFFGRAEGQAERAGVPAPVAEEPPINDDNHIDGRRLEELGAVGGAPPRHQDDGDDWCDDDWFDDDWANRVWSDDE